MGLGRRRLEGATTLRLSHWLSHALDELHNGLEPTAETQAQLAQLMLRLLAFTNLVHVRAGRLWGVRAFAARAHNQPRLRIPLPTGGVE